MQFVQSVPAAMVLRDHDDGELWAAGPLLRRRQTLRSAAMSNIHMHGSLERGPQSSNPLNGSSRN